MVRYQQADLEAADELIRQVTPLLFRFLSNPGVPHSETEDILQDCWLRIHKSRHTYRATEPVLPWLFAVARHAGLDHYRRRSRRQSRELAVETLPERPEQTKPADPLAGEDLARCVDQLPASQKEVIFMLKVSGMSLEVRSPAPRRRQSELSSRRPTALTASSANCWESNMRTQTEADAACRRVDRYLDERLSNPGTALPAEVADHLAACPRCAALFGWADEELPAGDAPAGIEDAVRSRILGSLRPVRPLPSTGVLAVRFLALFALFAILIVAIAGPGGAAAATGPQLLRRDFYSGGRRRVSVARAELADGARPSPSPADAARGRSLLRRIRHRRRPDVPLGSHFGSHRRAGGNARRKVSSSPFRWA